MKRPTPRYGFREAPGFDESVEALGGYPRLDDAITGLVEVLRLNPEVFPIVEGMKDIRLCKTVRTGDCPAMRWWFKIDEEAGRVELVHAETVGNDYGEG